jgi:hypothetical protein
LRRFPTTQDNGVPLTRRALLTAAGGLVVAGCRPKRRRPSPPAAADTTAVADALMAERELLGAYDAVIARADVAAATALSRARARHSAHVAALAAATRTPTAPISSTPVPAAPAAHVGADLKQSVRTLQAAAIAAADGPTAALLASIAAEHAADAAGGAGR